MEWNVVVTVNDFNRACEMLESFGRVKRTGFYNTLVMQVEDIHRMIEDMRRKSLEDYKLLRPVSRVIPVTITFMFQTAEEFELKAKEAVMTWLDKLGGKGFHVRMHRRGFKGRLSGFEEERFLDDILLDELRNRGTPGHIEFEDPDAVVSIETVANRAGLSLWTREQLEKYPFVRID